MPVRLNDNQPKTDIFAVLRGKSLPEAVMMVINMIGEGMGRKEKNPKDEPPQK